jgi:RNA polymerase sigma factor (sigma-70 family)
VRLSPSVAILRTQSDERLVELARDGSEPAFEAIVERYRRPMMRGCRRVLPESRAEDAVQQAFISAWRALERGDTVGDLRAWLMRIARNTALNALRVSGYDYDELRESLRGSEAPQSELERRDVVRQTLTGLAGLPERQRDALIRSAVEGASHAEIAKALGLSEGATRQLVLRARASLRSAATALTPGPLIAWSAWAGRDAGGQLAQRIAELTAGAGAGGGALLAKASIVTVVAGSVVVGPSVVQHEPARAKTDPPPAVISAASPASAASSAAHGAATAVRSVRSDVADGDRHDSSSGSSGKGSSSSSGKGSGTDDNSGPSSGKHGSDDPKSAESGDDSSGPGGGGSSSEPADDSSGSGSGSSGSGSSGSGDSGSSGSGSGDSSSSSSGSGSSGSGSGRSGEPETEKVDGSGHGLDD